MQRSKIVSTGPVGKIGADILQAFGELIIAPDNSEETLVGLLDGAIGLVVRGEGIANARVIETGSELKVIGRTGAGYNNVDIAAATARKIPVVYTPGANARAVAEGALCLIMALCKRVYYWDEKLKSGNWPSRNQSKPGDMEGATLGIVGFGSIGQNLAELVRSFKMRVVAYDPYVSQDRALELGVTLKEFDELMKVSDFISIHAPLTEETKGLINSETIKLIKPGAYLINLARGGLIESLDVIYDAMIKGDLAGVALDVFEPEPPDITHRIFTLPNCITSPHVHGMTPGAMAKILETMALDMAAVFNDKRPKYVINPEVFE